MAEGNSKFRLLVKAAPGVTSAQLSFNQTNLGFKMTPLQAAPPRRGVASAAVWHLLTPEPSSAVAEPWNVANPWDLCHELMRNRAPEPTVASFSALLRFTSRKRARLRNGSGHGQPMAAAARVRP